MRPATDRVSDQALRSSPVASAATATATTIALTGHSAEKSERPERTPKPARMG
jgi:hypothetical protein